MVTLTAAIQAGVVNPATTFVCNGSFKMGDRTFRCLGRHGRIDYARALERSCNVFFAELGTRLKREKMVAAARSYGFSRATGIDLIGESAGTLPDDERMKDKPWYPGDSVNLSVGQGYTSATPLQMANYVSVIANRGKSFKPHFLKMATEAAPDSPLKMTQPEIGCEVQLDDIWWDRIIKAMTRVIESGSGINARIRGLSFAGKTGSAEQRRGDKSHAWFVGFAPTENPRIAVAVVLETGGRGGSVAAPIAKALVERYLRGPATTQSSASSETTDSTASASSGLPSSR
jgi:penicillin-binding protein 2